MRVDGLELGGEGLGFATGERRERRVAPRNADKVVVALHVRRKRVWHAGWRCFLSDRIKAAGETIATIP